MTETPEFAHNTYDLDVTPILNPPEEEVEPEIKKSTRGTKK